MQEFFETGVHIEYSITRTALELALQQVLIANLFSLEVVWIGIFGKSKWKIYCLREDEAVQGFAEGGEMLEYVTHALRRDLAHLRVLWLNETLHALFVQELGRLQFVIEVADFPQLFVANEFLVDVLSVPGVF